MHYMLYVFFGVILAVGMLVRGVSCLIFPSGEFSTVTKNPHASNSLLVLEQRLVDVAGSVSAAFSIFCI